MIFIKVDAENRVYSIRKSASFTEQDKEPDEIIFNGTLPEQGLLEATNGLYSNGNIVSDDEHKAKVAERNPKRTPEPRAVGVNFFKLLFTSAERVAIKQSTDPTVQDFYDLLQDPRVTSVDTANQNVADAVRYLESVAQILSVGRAQEILDACKA